MIVAYIGNFVPEHSTENHVRQAFERQGHTVIRVQEDKADQWATLIERISDVDLIIWTRTNDLANKAGKRIQWEMLAAADRAGKPTVAYHLDRWWGLNREPALWEEPYFRCSHVITADGGHQDEFLRLGVNHFWLPPAVSLTECEPGEAQPVYRSDLAFVGSWQRYHAEWRHRPQLISWLQRSYGRRIQFWPKQGQPGIRGQELRNLYASVKIIIGDSCLVGGVTNYWSDRIPETVGRGGFLLHPYVQGIEEHFNVTKTDGAPQHLDTWKVNEWVQLADKIEHWTSQSNERNAVREAGRLHVIEHHTYDVRVGQILDIAT